ncbi:RNA polymerase sigma factor [Bacteroides sp. 224]|uniref:RNA polymerase sigma factor n=1 Tax=Bacteroides sp. 224 TaxID=2302936 RepID=UPI001EF236FB|nr:RNA polymerase sigma factor [Bacteroides sp. 224]
MESTRAIQSNVDERADLTTQLLNAFQAGDPMAFSRLYDLYINVLYNYGYRLTNDKELLKDCIHDVFVKVYTRRGDLGSIENFKSYIFISLKNKICDEVRKRINMSTAAIEDVDPVATDDIEKKYLKAEQERVEGRMIKHLMGQLSPRQREALTLYYIEERKYEDICEIMSMNYQSVRNLMHRGLVKLRSIAK